MSLERVIRYTLHTVKKQMPEYRRGRIRKESFVEGIFLKAAQHFKKVSFFFSHDKILSLIT